MRGKVKFYKQDKGYGFLEKEDKQGDIFFHVSDLVDRDHNPQQGDQVEFEIADGWKGKQKAVKVKRIVK